MYLSKEKPRVEEWQITVDNKYSEEEFIQLVSNLEELIFEHDFKNFDHKFYRKALAISKQNPDYQLGLLYSNRGFIEIKFPDRFKEEFFNLIHKIMIHANLKFYRGDFNKNFYEEIPKEEYESFLNKDYPTVKEAKFSENEVGVEYHWLSIKTNKKQSVIDLLKLEPAEIVNWNEATKKVYDNRIMIIEKDNCVTIVGPALKFAEKIINIDDLNHIEIAKMFVKFLSTYFGLVGYFMLTYKYGCGEMYIAKDGKLEYGRFWGDGDEKIYGSKEIISNLFFKTELDVSRNLFSDVLSFNRYEPLRENIQLYLAN